MTKDTRKVRPAALPPHGETMVRGIHFKRFLFPVRFCPTAIRGELIRTLRVE
jgi:hypothetical protein